MSGHNGQRILVTGASGFIGSHLCRRLRQDGAEVHAVYRSQPPADAEQLHWWQADLADLAEVKRIVRESRPDVIYHLASHVKGAPDLEHVIPTFQSNLQSTVNLLTVAADSTCRRIVLTGSLAEPDVQNGELFPSAPYAAAKWASSGYARMFHALYQLPVVIARVFMVYGPGQKDLTKLIPYVTLSLLQGQAPKISSGGRLVDWIYVSDVVDGFLKLGQASNIEGATIELGSGSLISIREIVQRVADIISPGVKLDFGALPDRPMEPMRIAKSAETEEKIGWKPEVSLDDGLRHTVDWYRAQLRQSAHAYASS
ncbi:MAG: SDR family NAD(P)-dependent oxidoreductase [Terracidiphilus sp.]